MINIVHVNIHCNDDRNITKVEIKLKSFSETEESENALVGHAMLATVSAAFYKTTLLVDSGRSLETALNPKRQNIVNLTINITNENLTLADVGRFASAFQAALDETNLFWF